MNKFYAHNNLNNEPNYPGVHKANQRKTWIESSSRSWTSNGKLGSQPPIFRIERILRSPDRYIFMNYQYSDIPTPKRKIPFNNKHWISMHKHIIYIHVCRWKGIKRPHKGNAFLSVIFSCGLLRDTVSLKWRQVPVCLSIWFRLRCIKVKTH